MISVNLEWFIVNYASLNSVPQESYKPVFVASVPSLFIKNSVKLSALCASVCYDTPRRHNIKNEMSYLRNDSCRSI